MKIYPVVLSLSFVVLLSCTGVHSRRNPVAEEAIQAEEPKACIDIDTSHAGLTIYYPAYDRVDLVCETPPSMSDSSVIFCCEAAYTGKPLDGVFSHMKIAGNHVSGGQYHKGYRCVSNSGAFVFYSGKYKFLFEDYAHELDSAARYGGMAFGQEMLIHEGVCRRYTRSASRVVSYRALCELDGRLCVIDGAQPTFLSAFVGLLSDAGVREALYLDMGDLWNYSWYREYPDSAAKIIHPQRNANISNWVTFYR